ncbi:MAG: sigma-70 family RNA polymerase sigma factor [Flavobacteriales bacterium]|jgi:RNA polymerase sigma factor (sigma-70 family)|nr:sigma-70 family RNA polymerase sigma factor [Flavobacteriales bacterium]
MKHTKLIALLTNGKQEKAFTYLYKSFPKVERFILSNSGTKEEALDIFQEGLILLYRKVNSELIENPEAFLIKTCQFLWNNELRKKKIRIQTSNDISQIIDENELEVLIEKENRLKQLEYIVHSLGEKCKSIFELFYYRMLDMSSIAKKLGYKNEQSAKVQKYKCMERARNLALKEI